MVNSEAFSERIEQILLKYDLSASAFAEKIGVGRSSISHILSGRNKPSLDFIMKILEVFPEIDLYWLMNGKGNLKNTSASTVAPSLQKEIKAPKAKDIPEKTLPAQKNFSDSSKEIKKIIVLYTDGSFEAFENMEG